MTGGRAGLPFREKDVAVVRCLQENKVTEIIAHKNETP
jgi:hypothetical protein